MGIYDRDYYREGEEGFSFRAYSAVTILIAVTVALYLIDFLFADNRILTAFAVKYSTLFHPTLYWQYISYGFVHSPQPMHIIGNMLQLGFLGGAVESRYGRREFFFLYIVMLIFGSLIWNVGNVLMGPSPNGGPEPSLIGASGAISGVVMLFVLNYPHATLMLFPLPIPIRALYLGIGLIVLNVYGSLAQNDNVAYTVHLAGIFFAFLYHYFHWRLDTLWQKLSGFFRRLQGPRLKIHAAGEEEENEISSEEVDRILEKYYRGGAGSLSSRERRILEKASDQYRKKLNR